MKFYRFPVYRRFVSIGVPVGLQGMFKLMDVDGFGIYVYYDYKTKPEHITPQLIRHCLIGERLDYCLLEAESIEEALDKFYAEIAGAQVGGEEPKHKAVYIDDSREIIELPGCELIHRNTKNDYICGKPDPESEGLNGEFGMCIFEGFDVPWGCQPGGYQIVLRDLKPKVEEFRGFKFIPLQENFLAKAAAAAEEL